MAIKTFHYLIRLGQPLSSDEWLRVVAELGEYASKHTLKLDDFAAATEVDRAGVKRENTRNYFEGFVHCDEQAPWKQVLQGFFRENSMRAIAFEE